MFLSSIYIMKVCSKCKIEKDDKEYYTYYHSTLKNYYTRNICQTCIKIQKKEYKLKIKKLKTPEIDYENNPDYRKCNKCGVYKLKRECYYRTGLIYFKTCKECELDKDRAKRLEKYYANGGSDRFFTNPNEYIDDYQKEKVFILMKAFGWVFNEDTQIWSKDGVKDKNGNWSIIKTYIRPKPPKSNCRKTPLYNLTYEAIKEYRDENMTYDEIGALYNVSGPAVRLKLKKYERENRGGLS